LTINQDIYDIHVASFVASSLLTITTRKELGWRVEVGFSRQSADQFLVIVRPSSALI
jgi:hypothetical protein